VMLHQIEECLKNPRSQWHLSVRPPQEAFFCVQTEIAEFVNLRWRNVYPEFHKFQKKFSRTLRTFRPVCGKPAMKNGNQSVTDNGNKTRKRTKRKNRIR